MRAYPEESVPLFFSMSETDSFPLLSFIFANLEIEAYSLFRENCRLTKNHFLTLSACVESAGIQVRARHSQENSDFLHFVFLFEVVGILQDQPG